MVTDKDLMDIRKIEEAKEDGKIRAHKKAEEKERIKKEKIKKEKEADKKFIELASGRDNLMGGKKRR